jgi:hypothetical protein
MFGYLGAKWGAVGMSVEFAPCHLHDNPDPAAERFLLALNSDMHHGLKDSPETLGMQKGPLSGPLLDHLAG